MFVQSRKTTSRNHIQSISLFVFVQSRKMPSRNHIQSISWFVFVQSTKMPSRNHIQKFPGMETGLDAIMASSKAAMKRVATAGAMGVSIAIPNVCKLLLLLLSFALVQKI